MADFSLLTKILLFGDRRDFCLVGVELESKLFLRNPILLPDLALLLVYLWLPQESLGLERALALDRPLVLEQDLVLDLLLLLL